MVLGCCCGLSVAEEEQVRHVQWMLGMGSLGLEDSTSKRSVFGLERAVDVLNALPLLARAQ